MLASDGNFYVVKFLNNPQHPRVLTNEMIAGSVARALGLPAPHTEVVYVSKELIVETTDLRIHTSSGEELCCEGPQFGSRFVGSLIPGRAYDYVPSCELARLPNLPDFLGMLAFDKWTCNADGRQAVFHRRSLQEHFRATFIDYGYCFNAGEWTYTDEPLRGAYARNIVYEAVTGWHSFEPWLTRIEGFNPDSLERISQRIPPEWMSGKLSDLSFLLERLAKRRSRVRDLIYSFRASSRSPFPNWNTVSIGPVVRHLPPSTA